MALTEREINNYFGDMDLFLMDFVLKGKIPPTGKVLDAGCGEGRNAVYFVQQGYELLGIDSDASKIRLAEYLGNNISTSRATFKTGNLRSLDSQKSFDLILCSRVLHFSNSVQDFMQMWENLTKKLKPGGLFYLSMDSTVENSLGVDAGNGMYEFPDGAIRFSLTSSLYEEIKKGFEEIEPLKTLIQNNVRAQSFVLLKKL